VQNQNGITSASLTGQRQWHIPAGDLCYAARLGGEVADLNGDGYLDLVVAPGAGDLSILAGNGDGTFQPAVFFTEVGRVTAADLNDDSHPDLTGLGPGPHLCTTDWH